MSPEEFTDYLASHRMPFGRFTGRPIYDLPLDYLLWFKHRGFPQGKLGEVMRGVCDAKAECGEQVFEPLRSRPWQEGAAPPKQTHWKLERFRIMF